MSIYRSALILPVLLLCLLVPSPTDLAAQDVINGCYVQKTGVIYRIDPTGTLPGQLPAECAKLDKHFQFDWNQRTVFNAHLNSFGLGSGTGVASAGRLSVGKYFIVFEQDIALCHRVAGLGHPTEVRLNEALFDGIPGEISTYAALDGQDRLIVVTRDSDGSLADKDFHVIVSC